MSDTNTTHANHANLSVSSKIEPVLMLPAWMQTRPLHSSVDTCVSSRVSKLGAVLKFLCIAGLPIVLFACGGSSSTDTVPSELPFTPTEGFPEPDGAAVLTAQNSLFTLNEDSSLDARLQFGNGETGVLAGGSPAAGFFITREPGFGEIELDAASGEFTYTPQADFFGLDSFRYYIVLDGEGSEEATVNINVTNINDPPQLLVELDRVVEQGTPYSVILEGTDADNESLTYAAENLPAWLRLNANTGLLRGEPRQTDVGIYRDIRFSVTDATGERAEAGPFALEVLDINDPPVINPAQFPVSLDAGERIVVNLFPDDPDGDFVTLETELNDFADVEILGGSLALTARPASDVTQINLVVIARDLLGSTSREIIPITIHPVTPSGNGRTLRGRSQGTGLHMVILAEGYKIDEANTFRDDVETLIRMMQQDPVIAQHFGAWNIHSVMLPSVDSGIDDDVTEDFRDTVFDAGYFCRGIERLICANDARIFDLALNEYPNLDQIVVLVNDPRYGGSGGSVAIASSNAPEIALHELGHSIAGLADEYVDTLIPEAINSLYFEGRFANISSSSDPLEVPWSHWIDDPDDFPTSPGMTGVGIFEGGLYVERGFFRPTNNSRMRENLALFGPVNGEQWALAVYQRSNPILEFSPITTRLSIGVGDSQLFSVTPLFDETVQRISWFIDDVELLGARGQSEISVQRAAGDYTVSLSVTDVSGRIRLPSPNASEFHWQWDLSVTSL